MCSISILNIGFKSSDEMAIRYEAIRIISQLRLMKVTSHVNYKKQYFVSDTKSNVGQFTIMMDTGYYIRENGIIKSYYELPEGIKIYMNKNTVVFNSDGSCTNTTITLRKNNSAICVVVDMAGRMRLSYE